MIEAEIVNIVASLKLKPQPSPREILEKIPGARPLKRFQGALMRIGRIPALFYRGKTVVTGVKSLEELDSIIAELLETLGKHGIKTDVAGREIINVTARAELGQRVNLRQTAERVGGLYDPDYRPYMIAKINNTRIILSQNGKIVVLGARSVQDAERALNMLIEKLGLKD